MKTIFEVKEHNRFRDNTLAIYDSKEVADKVAELSNALYIGDNEDNITFRVYEIPILSTPEAYAEYFIVHNKISNVYDISFEGVHGSHSVSSVHELNNRDTSGWVYVKLDEKEAMEKNALEVFKDAVKNLTKN